MKKKRVDELLVEKGLAQDLTIAKAFILEGRVIVNEQRVDKPSVMVNPSSSIRIKKNSKYVSRGGEKLEGALRDLGLIDEIKNSVVLDIGASTGGFTECCLLHGAKLVVALDVGTNQIDWSLKQDPRIISLEKTDIRDFKPQDYPKFDWVLADISFNSLARLATHIKNAAPYECVNFLLLVKPQFELPKEDIPRGGIVEDDKLRAKALKMVVDAFKELNFKEGKSVDSSVPGQSGNKEIFYYVKS